MQSAVPLFGPHALFNENLSLYQMGAPSQTIDLKSQPTLLFLEDSKGFNHIVGWDGNGVLWKEEFDPHKLKSLLVYDDGFKDMRPKPPSFSP